MSRSLKVLSLTVFVLSGMPRLNVKIGPLPIYAIDILLAYLFILARRTRPAVYGRIPLSGFVTAILIFAILSETSTLILYGQPLQPVYMLGRTLLAFSLFFSVTRIVKSPEDIQAVFKAGLLGLIVTSLFMIMSSLPPTRSIANIFFSYSFLEPAAEETLRSFAILEGAKRGRSLVGVSILSGAFINTFWPFVSLLYRWPGLPGAWRNLALLGTLLAPFAVVMSYSRGAIMGLFFVVGGLLFFGTGRNSRGIIIAALLSLTVFNAVGWKSEYFYFSRIEERVDAMINNPYEDVRETDRIYAYLEPFQHLLENPLYFFIGEGLSRSKISLGEMRSWKGRAEHALFAAAYYAYGMIASLVYILLVINAFAFLLGQMHRLSKTDLIPKLYAQSLFAGLLGMLPWLLFGHAAVSTPRGAMLFFWLMGMIAALKNFEPAQEQSMNKV